MSNNIEKKVVHGTIVIIFVGIIAKFTSFIAEAVLAAYIGTSYQGDAYYMVISIQLVIYPMLSVGVWKVFLPAYKDFRVRNEFEFSDELANKSITFFFIVSILLVSVLIIFAPFVVKIVAPGFNGDTRYLCIELVRLSSPMYAFIIISSVYASMLQCHGKFFGSQIREIASHIPTIFAAFFLYKSFGIKAMALALVIGGTLRFLVELPFVDWGYTFRPDLRFSTKEFSLILKRLPSALISEGVTQLNTLIDKAMASTLGSGTVSALNYAQKLMNVFSGLLSTAITTALYPQMIELISLKKEDELSNLVLKIINIFCILMTPVSFACVLFRKELVSVVFQRGAFTSESTALTSGAFAFYCISLFFVASNSVIDNVFYGYRNTKTPMYISINNLLINVVLNLVLIYFWGINGLALATSLSAIITFFIRLKAVQRYLKLERRKMLITALKVIIATIFACMIPRVIFLIHPINKYLILLFSAVTGAVLYFISIKLFKPIEVDDIIGLVKTELRKHKK